MMRTVLGLVAPAAILASACTPGGGGSATPSPTDAMVHESPNPTDAMVHESPNPTDAMVHESPTP
jgi:hypothetical protein